jgi:hypothetical protein
MLLAFLTAGQWVILLVLAMVIGLLALPPTRRYVGPIVRSVRTAMACVMLLITMAVSSIAIYGDLEYYLSGAEAEATITKIDSGRKARHVEYQFTEADGTPRTGRDTVDARWVAPANGTITIQYIPGEAGHSRVSRYFVHWMAYAVFLGSACLLLLIIASSVWKVMRGA